MSGRTKILVVAGLLVLVTLMAYWPATQAGFIWDDDDYVLNNETLRSFEGLGRIWFELGATYQYYPLVHTTYWLEYRLWGLDPTGYHVVNILLHAAGAVLLWRVLVALGVRGAWLAAVIFAVHPVHVESVAWITERKNVLSGVCYLGAALAYLRWVRPDADDLRRTGSRWLFATAVVLFLCALLSKTVACSLPATLLLVMWWKRGRLGWAEVRPLLVFFAVGIPFGLLTVWVERHHVGAVGAEWDLSIIDRGLIAGRALWFYAAKLIWPGELMFIYPRWEIDAEAWWQYLFPLSAAAVVVTLWGLQKRIGRGPLVAVLIFAGTLVPALGFFNIYPMRFSFVADHFQYLASIGLIVLAVGACWPPARLLEDQGRAIATSAVVVVVGALAILTWKQSHVYTDEVTLWQDTLDKNPDAWIAETNLGLLLQASGRAEEATRHLERRQALDPDDPKTLINLAVSLQREGRLDEAIEKAREALRLEPAFAEAHNNIGASLQLQGKVDEAIAEFRKAVEIQPRLHSAHANLGFALLAMGRTADALRPLGQAARLNPDDGQTQFRLGVALIQTGQTATGLGHLREAVRLAPDWPEAHNNAAWILATNDDAAIRDPQEAVRLARRAVELQRTASSLDTLAAAYASAGQFDAAVSTAREALDGAAAPMADQIRARLQLYEVGQPYRESLGGP